MQFIKTSVKIIVDDAITFLLKLAGSLSSFPTKMEMSEACRLLTGGKGLVPMSQKSGGQRYLIFLKYFGKYERVGSTQLMLHIAKSSSCLVICVQFLYLIP